MPETIWTKSVCQKLADQCQYKSEFKKRFGKAQDAARKQPWYSEICSHMPRLKNKWTFNDCLRVSSKYNTKSEFRYADKAKYEYARKRSWLESLCLHMTYSVGGYSVSDFSRDCEKNNQGYGTFYILKCWDDYEWFYKLGITSRTIEQRYPTNREMPYCYSIITEALVPSIFCWNLELEYKRLTNNYRYIPEVPFSTKECFKCNSNNKLLKEFSEKIWRHTS